MSAHPRIRSLAGLVRSGAFFAIVALGASEAVAAGPEAAPAREDGIALAPLSLEGDEDAAWRTTLEEALERGLSRAGIDPVDLPRTDAPCDALCWVQRAREANQAIVVRARIVAQARLYEIELQARDAADGAVVVSSTQPCQPCGRAEVESQLERQAAALGDRLVRLDLAPAMLVVDSTPIGAKVSIDGVVVGSAPLEVPMPAGSHRIEARLAGHEPRTREVTAVRGVTERWSVTLPAIASVPDRPPARRRAPEPLWPTGWALTGVGAPMLAVGITFIALDERPYRSRCSGADYDPAQDLCRYRWRSLVPGAVLTAIGGAMTATGLTLVGVGHRRRARAARETGGRVGPLVRAVAGLGPTGAALGLVGRF